MQHFFLNGKYIFARAREFSGEHSLMCDKIRKKVFHQQTIERSTLVDAASMNDSLSNWNRRFVKFIPVIVFFFALVFSVVTAKHYGLSWDEPLYYHASDLHMWWTAGLGRDLVNGNVARSLDDKRIQLAWHWDPYHVPHPPFSRIVSGVTHDLFSPWVEKFTAYRLGPALFFSLLVTVMYVWVAEVFGWATGLFAALAVVLTPNLFGFAHFAVTDMPLAAMWFLTAYCFWKGLDNWRWSVILGVVWGLALATKFPALLIPIPLLVWAHLFRRNASGNNIMAMFFLGPIVMVASQPYLWHRPTLRILDFLYEGLSRGYRTDTNFPIFFFGKEYLSGELPHYYPFFLTAITTPETLLALAVVGAVYALRRPSEQKLPMLFLFNAGFILAMAIMPGAVLHDGMRQLLSSCAFIAALAAVGFFWITRAFSQWLRRIKFFAAVNRIEAKASLTVAILALLPPAVDLSLYHPFELSYYNRLIGGLRGAYDRGLETTYFMEALTPEFLEYLNKELPPNARVNGLVANFMLVYYQHEGKLRHDLKITGTAPFDYAIVLNRRSVIAATPKSQRGFMVTGTPSASVSLGGVPLVYFYRLKN
jgi:Dolichyl-phosphate-mannose-protein mannosyltransferase